MMRFRDVFFPAFIFLMVVALFITIVCGFASLKEDRDAQLLGIEQERIALDVCLSKGYTDLKAVNHNYYCIRMVDGTSEVMEVQFLTE